MWSAVSLWLHLWGQVPRNYAHYTYVQCFFGRGTREVWVGGELHFVIHTVVSLFLSNAQLDSTVAGLIQQISLHYS